MDPLWYVVIATNAANSIATVVSTRVLSPRFAVLWAAFFNFVAMFVFPAKVAGTISKIIHINPHDIAFVYVVLAGLVGAVVWDLLTWWWGLPTSSSHALIGGLAGAGVAHAGWQVLQWDKVLQTIEFIPLAPLMGLAIATVLIFSLYWIFRKWRPGRVDALFRRGQLVSAALYSLGHGGNDAQKTMGVIVALLVAAGAMEPNVSVTIGNPRTLWIILACHAAMALGTAAGGWRIVKTLGMRITKLHPFGGFCAETAGAATLFMATNLGIPVSTTHTITGAIMGVGSARRLSAVKWGLSMRIVWAWLLTIPAAAGVAAGCYYLLKALSPAF
jgi:PiT family inorganic phosphate transporter